MSQMDLHIRNQMDSARAFTPENPIGLIMRAEKHNWTEQEILQEVEREKWFDRFHGAIRFVTTFSLSFIGLFVIFNFPAYSKIATSWVEGMIYGEQAIEQQISNDQLPEITVKGKAGKMTALAVGLSVDPPDFRIEIPGVFEGSIPVVETDSKNLDASRLTDFEGDIQESLRKGALHYPYTAYPGEIGNTFITAHSSYYPWDPGRYKAIFALLPKVKLGTIVTVHQNGIEYRYRINKKYEVSPSETSVLRQPQDRKMLTLMTCTPVGTTINRLIVEAELIENHQEYIEPTAATAA